MRRTWLKAIRQEAGITQAELGHAVGLSRMYIALVEGGQRNPSVPVAKKIAAALGFDWTRFFED